MIRRLLVALSACAVLVCVGCVTRPVPAVERRALALHTAPAGSEDVRHAVVRAAARMLERPYRSGGADPRGFDCSGLVVYTYGQAGVRGLPRTARELHAASRRIPMHALAPGDLLFFTFGGPAVSHVAIFVGDRSFVHAPKTGGRVERVSFDHPYWSRQLRLAGRLIER